MRAAKCTPSDAQNRHVRPSRKLRVKRIHPASALGPPGIRPSQPSGGGAGKRAHQTAPSGQPQSNRQEAERRGRQEDPDQERVLDREGNRTQSEARHHEKRCAQRVYDVVADDRGDDNVGRDASLQQRRFQGFPAERHERRDVVDRLGGHMRPEEQRDRRRSGQGEPPAIGVERKPPERNREHQQQCRPAPNRLGPEVLRSGLSHHQCQQGHTHGECDDVYGGP